MNSAQAERERQVEQELTDYLLGRLPEAARAQLETRYFADDALFEQLQIVKENLFDAYARGRLAATERAAFERHLLKTPAEREQLAFAQALHQTLNEQRKVVPAAPARAAWFSFQPRWAFAAALMLLLALGGWLLFENLRLRRELRSLRAQQTEWAGRTRQLQEELAALRAAPSTTAAASPTPQAVLAPAPKTAPPPSFVALALFPGTRSPQTAAVALPQATKLLSLQLNLNFKPAAGSCTASLLTADKQVRARRRGLSGRPAAQGFVLHWNVPADRLQPGDYTIEVAGRDAERNEDVKLTYHFRVERP